MTSYHAEGHQGGKATNEAVWLTEVRRFEIKPSPKSALE
jgi:hypothetical protein